LDAPDALTKCEGTRSAGTPASQISVRPGTKLAAIVDAMHHPGGATIAQMMAGNGWQAHTVRGAISGMVRKRLGYVVVTEKGADGRAYRIA
jgi:hypothetical protein